MFHFVDFYHCFPLKLNGLREEAKKFMKKPSRQNTPALKKKWVKPELLVIVRSKPGEAILQVCKTYPGEGGSSGCGGEGNCLEDSPS